MIRLSGYETLAACTVRMGALDGRRGGGGLLCGSGVVRPHALHCAVSWRVNVCRAPARLRGAFLTGDRVGVRLVRHRRSRIAAIRPEALWLGRAGCAGSRRVPSPASVGLHHDICSNPIEATGEVYVVVRDTVGCVPSGRPYHHRFVGVLPSRVMVQVATRFGAFLHKPHRQFE